jgi:hypothetical protein
VTKCVYPFAFVILVLCGCTLEPAKNVKPAKSTEASIDTLNSFISTKQAIQFFKDSILKGADGVIDNYFETYRTDTCEVYSLTPASLREDFEGVRAIKGIRVTKSTDTVFVVPRISWCEGNSYCFFDKTLPRLQTDSECCHPSKVFVVDDIDEDGVREIGIWYSSCTSRFKSLLIYTLKKNTWQEIASSDFDILTQDPSKVVYSNLVKKIKKGKFKICNFLEGDTYWTTITMK